MTARELLAALGEKGVELTVHEGRLRFRAPPGALGFPETATAVGQ